MEELTIQGLGALASIVGLIVSIITNIVQGIFLRNKKKELRSCKEGFEQITSEIEKAEAGDSHKIEIGVNSIKSIALSKSTHLSHFV